MGALRKSLSFAEVGDLEAWVKVSEVCPQHPCHLSIQRISYILVFSSSFKNLMEKERNVEVRVFMAWSKFANSRKFIKAKLTLCGCVLEPPRTNLAPHWTLQGLSERKGKNPKNLAVDLYVTSVQGTLNLLWYLSFIFPSWATLQSHSQPTPTTANTTVTSPLTLYQEALPHSSCFIFFWWGKFYLKFIPTFHLRSQEFYNTFYLEIISDLQKIARM